MFVETFRNNYDAVKRATFRERCDCWLDTRRIISEMGPLPPSVKVRFDALRWPPRDEQMNTMTRIVDADTIDCALSLIAEGFNPAALNHADDCMPGGCVDIGSGAQEESLFRRTTLCATLDRQMYPILDDEGIYSPEVVVLKKSEAEGWDLLEVRPRLGFLTVPGVKYPVCDYGPDLRHGEPTLKKEDARRLSVKVRTMLQMAHDHGHDSVVLGASGCGAWKCPPRCVADVFAEVLRECPGAFRAVSFAILRSPAAGERKTDDTFHAFVGVAPPTPHANIPTCGAQ